MSSDPKGSPVALSGGTLSMDHSGRGRSSQRTAPFLFRGLACDEPFARGARIDLSAADEVTIGRGERFEIRESRSASTRSIDVRVPDPRMSSAHAHLSRTLGKWVLEDQDSKNGTFVGGTRCERRDLEDRDVVELGRSFFYFREQLPVSSDDAGHLSGETLVPGDFFASSMVPALIESFADLERIAGASQPILLGGESGTGKELAARAVHDASGRRGAFVAVNCGALPDSLVESELFGSKKGAFSGADRDRVGLIQAADGGTLFLDEIGDLAPTSQTALLRAIQQKEVVPVGATSPVPVDFRLVSATHHDLFARVREGVFRDDLLARIAGFAMTLPPLRDRLEDLPLVMSELLSRSSEVPRNLRMSPKVARFLYEFRWRRNIRELEHALGSAIALAGDQELEWTHFAKTAMQSDSSPPKARVASPLSEDDLQLRARLVGLLQEHDGNVSEVARQFGKARMQIQRWIKRFGIDPSTYRRG